MKRFSHVSQLPMSVAFLALLKNGQQSQALAESSSKFQNAAAVHKEAALRHLTSAPSEEYSSSSEEDELEDSKSSGVLDKLKSSFGAASGIYVYILSLSSYFFLSFCRLSASCIYLYSYLYIYIYILFCAYLSLTLDIYPHLWLFTVTFPIHYHLLITFLFLLHISHHYPWVT